MAHVGEARPRQLRMRRPSLEGLPALDVPAGYGLRTFRAGDEAAWGAIMASPEGIGSEWTVEKVRATMMERPQFEASGLFFATCDVEGGRPVASAAAWRVPPEERATGTVHMVCALAEHRGRGLGRLVTLATMHYLRERGFTGVQLETDDWRLAAIRTYLGLGFVPVYVDDPASDHVARWSAIVTRLFQRNER
jgi:mycothiol synthase